MKRRSLLMTAALAAAFPMRALAGAQVEEALSDSVRLALSAAIANGAPPKPRFDEIESRLAYLRWLGAMSEKLKKRQIGRAHV